MLEAANIQIETFNPLKTSNIMDTTKLKPFDLQKALAGDPVVTHDMEMITPKNVKDYHISIQMQNGQPAIYYTSLNMPQAAGVSHHIDLLFMAPKVRTVWVNLYPSTEIPGRLVSTVHETEGLANDPYDMLPGIEDGNIKHSSRLGNRAYPIEITEE